MEQEEFERVVQEVFDSLPALFRGSIENVSIVVEDRPGERITSRRGIRSGGILLGLYEGVPLNKRGIDYGVWPVLPDRITLFRENLEAVSGSDRELRENIRDTLIHEIGHYYGMTERQIREAGY